MSELITYHSVVDTVDSWVDSANAVDNNTGTIATYNGLGIHTMILDTPASISSGTISKVEHRIYCSVSTGIPARLRFYPRFIAGDGDWEDVQQENLAWSSWYDITASTNAPGAWAWSDVSALGANVSYYWGSGPGLEAEVGSVEIKVTYEGAAPPTPMVLGAGGFKAKRNIIIGEI